MIPVVGINYKFQPILVSDVADAIVKAIETKDNHGKIYEIGGPQVISFGDMVKSIMKTLNKKRFVVDMPMPIAKDSKYTYEYVAYSSSFNKRSM